MESGLVPNGNVVERVDHLGIDAGMRREIGLAEWLDAQDTHSREQVSVGTAPVVKMLKRLDFTTATMSDWHGVDHHQPGAEPYAWPVETYS